MKSIDYNKLIADKITKFRIKENLSARELSLKLNLSSGYINQIENGKKSISIHNLIKICQYFKISLSEFFYIEIINLKSLNLKQQHLFKLIRNLNFNQINAIISLIESFEQNNIITSNETYSIKNEYSYSQITDLYKNKNELLVAEDKEKYLVDKKKA